LGIPQTKNDHTSDSGGSALEDRFEHPISLIKLQDLESIEVDVTPMTIANPTPASDVGACHHWLAIKLEALGHCI
jgi:hypothetical protein